MKLKLVKRALSLLLAFALQGTLYSVAFAESPAPSVEELSEISQNFEGNKAFPSVAESLGNDFINLNDDYFKYLQDNGIEVFDGNICVQTVEQFVAIRDYYYSYLNEIGAFYDIEYLYHSIIGESIEAVSDEDAKKMYVAINLFNINYTVLDDNLKRELVVGGLVSLRNNQNVCCDFAYENAIKNEERILEGAEGRPLISTKCLVFDNDARKVSAMFEEDLKTIQKSTGTSNQDILIQYTIKYMQYLYDEGANYQPKFSEIPLPTQVVIISNVDALYDVLNSIQYEYQRFVNYKIGDINSFAFIRYDEIKNEMSELVN